MNYKVVDGADKLNLDEIIALLRTTYWANSRSEEQIKRSVENSRCYGVILEDTKQLVGFARVISDFATTYYLCDVVIAPEYRGNGMGTAMVSYIENLDIYSGLRGVLITRDAHALYEKFGYSVLNGRAMVKGLNC